MPDKILTVYIIDFSDNDDMKLKEILEADGFQVLFYEPNNVPGEKLTTNRPNLILMRLSGDKGGGLACCRNFRSAYPECAIILIHDKLSEWEESIALELGADTIIRRPSDARRVLAQARALLRRQERNPSPRLELLEGSRMVKVNNQLISLTDAEFELLKILAQTPGKVVSRDTISQHLSGLDYDSGNRTIDLRIARIRSKLGDNANQSLYIRTIRGEGYMLMTNIS